MLDAYDIDVLLELHGHKFEVAAGYVIEIKAERTDVTDQRPHGLSYALVFRPDNGEPYVRFDNAHAVEKSGSPFMKSPPAYDHWHRSRSDRGRPYHFTTAVQLLTDFWAEVKRVMNEKGIPNDL